MFMRLVIFSVVLQSLLFAAPGDLDTSFGNDGIVITDAGGGQNQAHSVAIQSDGKIVAAGGNNDDFILARYNTDGSLDTNFGIGGIVATDVGSDYDYVSSIAIQSDGKIVSAGRMWNGNQYVFALTRHNTNGLLDANFGTEGIVTTAIGNFQDIAYSVAIQSDGKIVAAGENYNGSKDFALVRYNTDGSRDASFGTDGIVTTMVESGHDHAYSVAIQSDGKIVAIGYSNNGSNDDFAVVRYETDGTLDTNFGTDGIVTTAIGSSGDRAYSVAIQSDGKIVAAGLAYLANKNQFALVRYDTNGSLDTGFDGDGIVTTVVSSQRGEAYSVAIQSNGKLVAAGLSYNGSNNDFSLVCYTPDGSLDTNFGTEGIVTTEIGSGTDTAYSVAIQSDGKIVAAGTRYDDGYNFALVRYEGDPVVLTPIYYLLQ